MQFGRKKREIWLGNSDFWIQQVKIGQGAPVATNEHDLLLALISQQKVPRLLWLKFLIAFDVILIAPQGVYVSLFPKRF